MLLVLKKQAEKHNEIQQNIETYQHGYKESLDILNKCIQTLENINIEKVNLESTRPMNREEIAEQLGEINMLQSSLQNMKLANDNLKSLENKMGDYKKQEDILKTELQKLDENLLGIKNLKNEKQEQLNILLQQQNQHAAVLMAKNLIEGEKCPVCGSLEHPDIARDEGNDNDSELDHKQKEMQISIDADQEYIRSLEHEIIKLKQQQLSIKELVLQGETELQDKKTAYQKQRQALPKALTLLEEAEISDYIIQNRAALEKAVEVYYLWEQKQQQLKDNIKLQENNLSEARIQQSRLATLLDSANTALGQEQKQQVEQQKAYELIYAEHKQMLKDMNVDSFSQEAEKISHKDEQLHQHTIVNKQKRIELDKVTAELQSILENINEVGNILSDKRSEGIKLKEQKEEKERKIKAVVGDKDLRTELEKAKQEIDALEILYKSSQEELNKTNQTIEEIQRRRAGLQSSFEHYKDKMQTDSKRLKEALRDKGFGDELEVEKCMLEDDRLKL
jgi:exonuclease SbcC